MSHYIKINQYRRRPSGHIPAELMKRYRIESEFNIRGKSSGQCALLKDGVLVEWFAKQSAAKQVAREMAKQDMKNGALVYED